MFAFFAALAFGLALLLDLLNLAGHLVGTITLAGLLLLALHVALGTPWPWHRR